MSAPVSRFPLVQLRNVSAIPITNGLGEAGNPANDEAWPRYIRTTDIAAVRALDANKRVTLPQEVARLAPVLRGDILMTSAGATVGKSYLHQTDEAACFAGYLSRLRVRPDRALPEFVAYWTESPHYLDQVQSGAVKSTIENFSAAKYRAMWMPLPPLEEQRAIADYLDRETAQIDAFIAKNEELITLLTERRGAVIARAVLRGLDASVELRDSGVTWLGEVPSHWRVSRLSRWFEVTLGKMLDEAKFAGTVGDVLPYVRASNIKAERLDLSDVNSMPFTPSEQVKFSLRNGDLVVVEGGSIGVNAPIEEDMHGWGFQKTVNRVRAIRGDLTRFLGYQIDVIREAGVLNMITNVSTIQHLTAEKLERIVVAMPPIEEQEAIVSHIRRATSAIDRAVETAEEGVRLARERRAALISAAVTGKIDVGVSV